MCVRVSSKVSSVCWAVEDHHPPGPRCGLCGACGVRTGLKSRCDPATQQQRQRKSPGRTVDPNLEEEFVFLDCIEEDPHQEEKALIQQLQQQQQQISSPPPVSPPEHLPPPPQKQHLRSLERQLQALRGEAKQEPHPDSLIQFHDGTSIDENLVAARRRRRRSVKVSTRSLGLDVLSRPLLQEGELMKLIRYATPVTHHHKALNSCVQRPDKAVVADPPPPPWKRLSLTCWTGLIIPTCLELVGPISTRVALGNKIDLAVRRDSPSYSCGRIKQQLIQYCQEAA
ncbi:nitric oxide-associated protein 1 [Lates japonicus]|uniref:Nitric oxide-associated protein 1 n=1 Tax=Lates japonicus TaxID=270547 RepID=A0AAD3RJF3_LATJO|nr:nitric oxide-associated protein 1 [Lates japonicus]